MMPKSQSTTEFLTILIAVILLVLITVGILLDVPSLFFSIGRVADEQYFATLPVAITAVTYEQSSSNATFYLRNNLRERVQIDSLLVKGDALITQPFNLSSGERRNVSTTAVLPREFAIVLSYTLPSTGEQIVYDSADRLMRISR